ncbi:dual specificity phosphatase [Mycena latifolia]|nr:dual specificity phosphatase [Mycena latifolia]
MRDIGRTLGRNGTVPRRRLRQILPPAPLAPAPSAPSPYAPYTSSSQAHGQQMSGGLYLGSLSAANDHRTRGAVGAARKEGGRVRRVQHRHPGQGERGPAPASRGRMWYIEGALRRWEGVLVHCQQGVSRSPSIVIAYLIRNHAMSYDAALAFVKRKCACAKPNPGFAHALIEWEHSWRRPAVQCRFTS